PMNPIDMRISLLVSLTPRSPYPTLFPYTTLFRSISNDSFIEEGLQDSRSDLLYGAMIDGAKSYVYFLFEHKSYPTKDIALQLLGDWKSTRLNSSHVSSSYAVFCLKKKTCYYLRHG